MATFGDILSELRADKGLKQKDLADLLNVAVTTISGYENDIFTPDLQSLAKLAEFFDVSADYLLGLVRSRANMRYIDKEYCKYDNQIILAGEAIKRLLNLPQNSRNTLIEYMKFLEDKENKQTKK